MRLLSQSTRATIRTLTLLFALTSLLLTMMTPFAGTARAAHGPYMPEDGDLDNSGFTYQQDLACSTGDDDKVKGGIKADDIHLEDPAVLEEGSLGSDKFDLCEMWLDSTVDDSGDVWLYAAFMRPKNAGTTHTAIELLNKGADCDIHDYANCNPWENRTFGTRIIGFTWQGNDDLVNPKLWTLNGGWDAGQALEGNFEGSTGNDGKFGEFAVNLSAAGILASVTDSGAPCDLISSFIPFTLSGFSLTSEMKDVILGQAPPVMTCGAITVIKDAGGDDFGDAFNITLTGGSNDPETHDLGDGDSFTDAQAKAHSDYTVSENLTGLDGWTITSISCDDDTSVATGEGETELTGITVEAGETTACTVTNTPDLPNLTIVKQVINDNGGSADATDFTVRSNGDAVALTDETPDTDYDSQASHTLENIAPGDYTITEDDPAPAYENASITCDDADGGDTATLALGESATCWVVNDDLPGELELEKVIMDNDGLYPDVTVDDFVPTIGGNDADWGPHTLDADTYTIGEEDAAGSSLLADGTFLHSSTVCDGLETSAVTVVSGETVKCTITNTAVGAGLTVIKEVNNDWGGQLEASAFPLAVTDSEGATTNVVSEVSKTFPAGDYTIAEEQQTGYELSDSFCTRDGEPVDDIAGESFDISVGAGETVICTFVNQDVPATVTLEKAVINDNGGLLDQSDFPSFLDGDPLAWDTTLDIAAGGHTASETEQAGYTAGDWGGDCGPDGTFTADLATNYVCTITNDDVPGTLFISKEALNDDGGTTLASDFDVFLDGAGTPVTWTATSVDQGTGVSTAGTNALLVEANTPHTITEDLPSGYTMSGVECTNGDTGGTVTVQNGETVECIVFNDDAPAGLTIVKDVVNDDEGALGPEDFPLELTPEGGETELVDSGAVTTVPAGTYTVGEQQQEDYELVSIVCDNGVEAAEGEDTVTVTVANGESVICTITNDDVPPVVIVGEILGSVEPVCDADAGYLNYEASTVNVDGEAVTIHWFDADGVERHTDVVDGLSGQVLWPGAEVDDDGFATDWPGFVFDGEVWEEGDDGFGWANGEVTVALEVNPTTEPLTASYPSDADAAAGEDCLPPEIEVAGQQFEQPAPELPRTGLKTLRMALWAALLAGLGALILLATDTPTATVRQRR